MSGLAGLVTANPSPPSQLQERLAPVLRKLAHRGAPCCRTNSALAQLFTFHREPAPEPSPEAPPPVRLVFLWDGRLDNSRELARELDFSGSPPALPDLLAAAWIRWHECLPEKLRGDFAFAVWEPARRSLFAARDPFGLRPFFYSKSRGEFSFASETRALLALPGVRTTPDESMLADFFAAWGSYPDVARTFFDDVRRLPPGCALRWQPDGFRTWRWWHVDAQQRMVLREPVEYRERFLHLLEHAVARRVAGRARVAVFLSGGFDSGSVAAFAARALGPQAVHAFTGHAPGPGTETPVASDVARHLGVQQSLVSLPLAHFGPWLEPYVERNVSPIADKGAENVRRLMTAAHAQGCPVVLTGDGADALFGAPNAYVADLTRTGRLVTLFKHLRGFAEYNGYGRTEMLGYAWRMLIPQAARSAWAWWKWRHVPNWVSPEFARRSHLRQRMSAFPAVERFPSISATRDYASFQQGRRIWIDESREIEAAHLGIELAYPYYDIPLVQFMLAIPWHAKYEAARNKVFLRDAPGLLPESLRHASRKGGVGSEVPKDLAADEWAHKVLGASSAAAAACLPGEPLETVLRSLPQSQQPFILWLLARFLVWLRSIPPATVERS